MSQRIGLLTYHHVANIGSVLQTYCGYRLLEELYPSARIEIIDYYPTELQRGNRARILPRWWSLPRISYFNRQHCFSRFLRQRCHFSPKRISDDNCNEVVNKIRHLAYDIVFVGSDTVFQLDGFFGKLVAGPAAPNAYFLPGDVGCPKVGLCVSFDPLAQDPDRLDWDLLGGEYLRDFAHITYRDDSSRRALQAAKVESTRMSFCPDPTLMTDLPDIQDAPQHSDAIGVYTGWQGTTNKIIRWLKSLGYEAHDFNSVRGFKIHGRLEDFLRPFTNLKAMITDRFHGTILAAKYGRYPIIGFEDAAQYSFQQGKLSDLYSRLGIEDYCLRIESPLEELDNHASKWLTHQTDMTPRMKTIAALRTQGRQELPRALAAAGLL